MISDAVIVATGEAVLARVGGLSLLQRSILTAAQAGMRRAVVLAGANADPVRAAIYGNPAYARAGISVAIVSGPSALGEALVAARHELRDPFVIVPADRVYASPLLKTVAASDVSSVEAWQFGECGLVVATPALLDELERATSLADAIEAMTLAGRASTGSPGAGFWHDARTPETRASAERELLARLRKPSDGPVARTIIRPISRRITRRLMNTSITPNQITAVASLVGFIGVGFVLQSTWLGLAVGSALSVLQCILDHPDGEISRLKFQGSRLGAFLDHAVDNVLTLGYGLAIGWAAATLLDDPIYWRLSVGGAIGFAVYDVVLYHQIAFVHRSGNPFDFRWWFQKDNQYISQGLGKGGSAGAKLVEALHATARRDVFCFGWAILGIARLPQVAVVWFLAIGAFQGGLAIAHVFARLATRRR